jgi:hypothetical protein
MILSYKLFQMVNYGKTIKVMLRVGFYKMENPISSYLLMLAIGNTKCEASRAQVFQ